MLQSYQYKIKRKKKWPVKYVVFQRFVEIRGFWTLRCNTWFSNASLKYVVFQRFAKIRASFTQLSIWARAWTASLPLASRFSVSSDPSLPRRLKIFRFCLLIYILMHLDNVTIAFYGFEFARKKYWNKMSH